MIIDSATIVVRSGRGGDGAVSFRRMKYIPKGGPDGGDGGNGGSVVLLADPQIETLLDLAGRHHYLAEHGEPGRSKQQHGKNGTDLTIHLPPGTLVYDETSGDLIVDLDAPHRTFPIAQGGRGGFGNEHFKSATNQTPRQSSPGELAEEKTLRLELKLIADVGLVGLPNAGKSTLLSRISRATPKIADYPFTTLEPQLGIAELPGDVGGRRLVVADLPGLIEHAHKGQGLGTRFLRHIERTRLLVHLIDIAPIDGSDPIENYRTIRHELASYTTSTGLSDAPAYSQATSGASGGALRRGLLASKPEVVVLSKIDTLPDADRAAAVERIEKALGQPVFAISAVSGQGIAALLEGCRARLEASE